MATVIKCENPKCEIKETCFRFKAKTNSVRQHYLPNRMLVTLKGDCTMYFPVRNPAANVVQHVEEV